MRLELNGVDESLVRKINELAKEQGISRNQFIKNYLAMMPYNLVLDYEVGYLEDLINTVDESAELTNARLKSLEDGFGKVSLLIKFATNMSEYEMTEVLGEKEGLHK